MGRQPCSPYPDLIALNGYTSTFDRTDFPETFPKIADDKTIGMQCGYNDKSGAILNFLTTA